MSVTGPLNVSVANNAFKDVNVELDGREGFNNKSLS